MFTERGNLGQERQKVEIAGVSEKNTTRGEKRQDDREETAVVADAGIQVAIHEPGDASPGGAALHLFRL